MKRICNKKWCLLLNNALLFVLVCIAIIGCTDVTFEWEENRSGGKILGFVDDSLVIVGDYLCWEEITDRWNGEYIDLTGCGYERLCTYNYRVQ